MSFVLTVATAVALMASVACSEPAAAPAAPQQAEDTSPKLGVNSLKIDLEFPQGDSKTVTRNITFMNEGGGVMIWAVRKTVPWIWMEELDGALEKGYSKDLKIYIAPSGKEPGTYTENITIEGTGARNSPQTVVVSMVIKPPAAAPGTEAAVARNPVPLPPWDYNEYFNSNYDFRLRYPKEFREKPLTNATFGAVTAEGTQDANYIRVYVASSYGVSTEEVALEWAKAIRLSGGGASPKILSSENVTLLDGVTPGFEILYESKSATKISSHVYIYGTKKGNRFILFGAVAPLAIAPDKLPLWKEIAHTLEFVDNP